MSAVATIKPNLLAISAPEMLRSLPGWLTWRYEHVEGEDKPRKVPYYTGGGKRWGVHGRPEDRRQLTTFDAAKAAAARRGFDGVGFAPMPEWGVAALDFDACLVDGGVHPEVRRAVAGTYAEFSPSGQGVRAFVRGELGNRKSHNGPFGFETFSSSGFVTFTGNMLDGVEMAGDEDTVAPASAAVLDLCERRFGCAEAAEAGTGATEPMGLSERQLRDALDVLDPSMRHDPWIKVGMALHHETRGEGFHLWDAWSAAGASYPGSAALQARWDSFGRGGQRPTTVHYLVNLANEHGAHIELTHLALADFDVIAAPPVPAKPSRFAVVPDTEFMARPAPQWIVKGVVPQAELLVLFGESGAGKSFVALDLFGAVARGVPWRGHRVRQGRVVYVAAEGAGGFRNRLVAYQAAHGVPPGLGVIHAAPNLLLKDDALDVAKSIQAAGGADVVVVDTFAQTTPGANENAAEDMGKALAHCKGIHRATGALVVLVHHAGKDASKGARGWSGLKAAADAEIEVVRTAAGRVLRTSKQKDGEDGQEWGFELKVVPIGHDADGDEITSCVVAEAALPPVGRDAAIKRKLGKWEHYVVAAINEIAEAQTSGIEIEAVLELAMQREPKPEGRDTRRQHARRALQRLADEPDSPYFIDGDSLSIG